MVLDKVLSGSHLETISLTKVRSNLIRTLIKLNKLEEAKDLAGASLVEATTKVLRGSKPIEVFLLVAVEKVLRIKILESIKAFVPWLVDQCIMVDATALDTALDISCARWDRAVALALFDLSLVMEAREGMLGAATIKETVIEAVWTQDRSCEFRIDQMSGFLICNYCALSKWEDADRELKMYLERLEFTAVENFPMTYCNLLHVASAFATHDRSLQSVRGYISTDTQACGPFSGPKFILLVQLVETSRRAF